MDGSSYGFSFKKEIASLLGPYDTNFEISADYDYEIRLFKSYSNDIKLSNITLTEMKIGGLSNRNIKSIIKKTFEDFKIMRNNAINPFIGLFFKNLVKLINFGKNLIFEISKKILSLKK